MEQPQLPLAFNPQLVDQSHLNAIWLHPQDFLLQLHAIHPGMEFDEPGHKWCWIKAMENSLDMICLKFAPPSQEAAVNYIKHYVESVIGPYYEWEAGAPQHVQLPQAQQQQLPVSTIQNQQENQTRPSVIQPPFTQLPQGTKSFAGLAQSRWAPEASQSVLLPRVLVDNPERCQSIYASETLTRMTTTSTQNQVIKPPKEGTAIYPVGISRSTNPPTAPKRESPKPVKISKMTAENSQAPSQQAELLREVDVKPEQYQQAAELFGTTAIKFPSGLAPSQNRTDDAWWSYAEDFARDMDKHNPSVTFTRAQYDFAFGMAIQKHRVFLGKLSNRTGRAPDALLRDAIESVNVTCI